MLQTAGRMKSNFFRNLLCRKVQKIVPLQLHGNNFGNIPAQGAHARRLRRIGRVSCQQVAVFLHRHAASARRHDNGLYTRLDHGPPRIDQRAHVIQPVRLMVEVVSQRAATAGTRDFNEGNSRPIEHPRGGGIDARRKRGLHAAREHEHTARMPRIGPDARRRRLLRHRGGDPVWQ